MWIISFNSFLYILSWLPLEGKLWLLEAFFGYRYGSLIFWILYQLSNDRGSFKSITHDTAYDKSYWSCATSWILYSPIWVTKSAPSYIVNYGSSCYRLLGRAAGLFAAKKQIPLAVGWEIV